MPGFTPEMPWIAAWIELQRQYGGQALQTRSASEDAMRRLAGFGGEYVGVANDWWQLFRTPGAGPAGAIAPAGAEAMRAIFTERYRQLFTPEFARAAPAPDSFNAGAAAMTRWQAATQRLGLQAAAIAADASQRLAAQLLSDDEGLAPVTSLRQLHELWIDCGEAAYAAAARGDEFAEAQAELLGAWVELQAAARSAQR